MIGRRGEKGTGISMQAARHDDDDDDDDDAWCSLRWGWSYTSGEMQSVYSTVPNDCSICKSKLELYRQ